MLCYSGLFYTWRINVPVVKGKHYPYTKKGKAAAAVAKKSKKPKKRY